MHLYLSGHFIQLVLIPAAHFTPHAAACESLCCSLHEIHVSYCPAYFKAMPLTVLVHVATCKIYISSSFHFTLSSVPPPQLNCPNYNLYEMHRLFFFSSYFARHTPHLHAYVATCMKCMRYPTQLVLQSIRYNTQLVSKSVSPCIYM